MGILGREMHCDLMKLWEFVRGMFKKKAGCFQEVSRGIRGAHDTQPAGADLSQVIMQVYECRLQEGEGDTACLCLCTDLVGRARND